MLRSCSLLLTLGLLAALPASEPVRIIFDTDFESDCDDAGALAMLHALADRGECEILACVTSGVNADSPAAVDVINTWYGRGDIPLAASKRGPNRSSRYAGYLADHFPHDTPTAAQLPDPADLYRQVLAAQPDGSVVICTVGYTTNLKDLLESGPDAASPLNGTELVARKVRQWVCMGGNFWRDDHDPNLMEYDPASTIFAVGNWPTNITFAGREVGSVPSPLRAGARLQQTPADNPVRVAYERYFDGTARDRHCADQAAVLHAVRGHQGYWDLHTEGSMVFTGGKDYEWRASPDRDQDYLVPYGGWQTYTNERELEELIEDLMVAPPALGSVPGADADLISATTFVAASAGWDHGGDHGLALAHDGSTGSSAHAHSDAEQWLEYAFAGSYALDRVRVWEDDGGNLQLASWRLEIYDGSWREVVPARSANADGWHAVDLGGVVASAIRFHGHGPSGKGLEIYELECSGEPVSVPPEPEPQPEPTDPVDLVSATTFTAASDGWRRDSYHPVDLAHDDDAGSSAHAPTDSDQWLEYTFDRSYALDHVRVNEDNGGNLELASWRLEVFDGSWREVVPSRAANAAGWHEVALGGVVASAIRFHGRAPSGKGLEIYELECYGVPATAPPPPTAIAVAINFQPAGAAVPIDHLADAGAVFADRGNGFNYGWQQATSHTRDRGATSDQRADTLNHMQKPGEDALWEIALPAGLYAVTLLAGDPSHDDSHYRLAVEGEVVLDHAPTTGSRFAEVTVVVAVDDGRLTLSNADGASNNKVCAIAIEGVPDAGG